MCSLRAMLNVIWLCMIVVAVLVGGFTGRLEVMTEGAFIYAQEAVMKIALPLVGLMAIWMGMMRLAEQAGLVRLLARALRPVTRILFPDVPAEHPAMGAMMLNMSANMLGLGNAATPLGLRAMALLQKLNNGRAAASNAMVTFLALNTASIQLVPTTAISILAIKGSRSPSSIVIPAIIATGVAMAAGLLMARLLAPVFPAGDDELAEPAKGDAGAGEVEVEQIEAPAMTGGGRWMLGGLVGAFVLMWGIYATVSANPLAWLGFPPADALRELAMKHAADHSAALAAVTTPVLKPAFAITIAQANAPSPLLAALQSAGVLAVPFLLAFFPLYAHARKVKVYEQFCVGARDAFGTAQRIIPFLVAMLVAIRLLRDSGVLGLVTDALRPGLAYIGFPADLLPLAVMRPLSGSASNGIFVELVQTHGADSLIARMAATIYGSTETTFYVLAVYFGSVGIRRTRHAVVVGLTADLVALIVAITVCRLMFG